MSTTDGLLVRFFIHRERDNARSDADGREIVQEHEAVAIKMRGSPDEIVRLVTDDDKQRWPDLYRAWKSAITAPIHGTPLDDWPGITRSLIEQLANYGIRSVEQLAAMPEDLASLDAAILSQRSRAIGWIAAAGAGGDASRATLLALAAELPKTKRNAEVLAKYGLQQETADMDDAA